jgi:hypothetical protein
VTHKRCRSCQVVKPLVCYNYKSSTINEHIVRCPNIYAHNCIMCCPPTKRMPLQQQIEQQDTSKLHSDSDFSSILIKSMVLYQHRLKIIQSTIRLPVQIIYIVAKIRHLIKLNFILDLVYHSQMVTPKSSDKTKKRSRNNKEDEVIIENLVAHLKVAHPKFKKVIHSFQEFARSAQNRSKKRGIPSGREHITAAHLIQAWREQKECCTYCGKIMSLISYQPQDIHVVSVNRKDSTDKQSVYHDGIHANFDLQHWGCNRDHSRDEIIPWLLAQNSKWQCDIEKFPTNIWLQERYEVQREQLQQLAKKRAMLLANLYNQHIVK